MWYVSLYSPFPPAQTIVVHFIYAHLKLNPTIHDPISFYVPTGAGGHVTAGILTRLMGLKSAQFHLCTNANDILDRVRRLQ